jgi:hypothetical protein
VAIITGVGKKKRRIFPSFHQDERREEYSNV